MLRLLAGPKFIIMFDLLTRTTINTTLACAGMTGFLLLG